MTSVEKPQLIGWGSTDMGGEVVESSIFITEHGVNERFKENS